MTALTYDRVIEIIGRQGADAHQIKEIIDTGATEEELIEAYERVSQGSVGVETRRPPGATVGRLMEVLSLSEQQWAEDESPGT